MDDDQLMVLRLADRGRVPCHYCRERPGTTDDHIVPRARVIALSLKLEYDVVFLDNKVWACEPCNAAKADRYPPPCDCPVCSEALAYYERLQAADAGLTRWQLKQLAGPRVWFNEHGAGPEPCGT